jgi:eukaryotic-like serine/threonine-protein kinase
MNEADPIETLCDEAEGRLKTGAALGLTELVARCPLPRRERLSVELLLLEIDYQRRAGGLPQRDDYLSRYGEIGAQVEAAFCLIDPDGPEAAEAGLRFSSLATGQSFSHYQLQRLLGAGATCQVWKATDRMTGREVALKIPRWRDQSIDQRLRFLREGRALSRLRHPGVVTLYELGRDGALPHLAIELIEGGTLRDVLQKGELPPCTAAELCRGVAAALDHAHQRGVLHRDVKPGNILLRAECNPVLTDFGLAKDARDGGDLTEHGDVLGTLAYMAPEQAAGRSSTADARADVYGVGIVLYEALTGVPPTRPPAGTAPSVYEGADPRRLMPSLPRDLAAICNKATQPRPADRYPNAAHLVADLDRFLTGHPVVARYPTRLRQAMRRFTSSWATAALVFLSLSAALGVMITTPFQDGLREVTLAVVPPSARVAFVPLREWGAGTGPLEFIVANGVGRMSARLLPGPYYVVAVAPDGRFHEVQRYVPAADDEVIRPGDYRQSERLPTGEIRLKAINVPAANVTQGMTRIAGTASYVPGGEPSGLSGAGYAIAPFDIDRAEFGGEPEGAPAWTGSYYDAVDAAEQAGKRLPTELEHEFAATAQGQSRYPWGDEFPARASRDASFDRLAPAGEVAGLVTGVAEWTTPIEGLDPARPPEHAVARGGDNTTVAGDLRATAASCNSLCRVYLPEVVAPPGVGFRAVRSAAPRFNYDEIR